MYQITEITNQGDFFASVVRTGMTMRQALDNVLTESPYNGSMSEEHRVRIAQGLVTKEPTLMSHGWATYTAQYRHNLEDSHVSYLHRGTPEFGIVVQDDGDTLVVRHPASAAQQEIKATSIVRYK